LSKISLEGNVSGSGTLTIAAPNTNSNFTLTLPQGTGTFVASGVNSSIVSGTAQASTSGTSIDFTGIPSWVKRITVMFSGVSTSGTSPIIIQLGTSSGVEATSYSSTASRTGGGNIVTNAFTTGLAIDNFNTATNARNGFASISLLSSNTWTYISSIAESTLLNGFGAGIKALSSTLDRVRITTVNGTDTFDAGSINILYE